MKHDPYGCYRVIDPPGALPQNCWKLDNDPTPRPGETLVQVEALTLDSASFRQLKEQSVLLDRSVADLISNIVAQRGKLHNPVTGSGGMLMGRLPSGEKIATLVSLTLTPLKIDQILALDEEHGQVQLKAQAILFEKTLYCQVPDDLPGGLSLAVLDVAGAPAQAKQLAADAEEVLLVGAGKAGFLCAAAVRRENPEAKILAVDVDEASLDALAGLGLCDWSRAMDARKPLAVYEAVSEATGGRLSESTFNLVNVPGTEGTSILATRDGGSVYFFGMATSFSAAALTAEGLARDVRLIIGSGYTRGWTDYALGLVRENEGLRAYFEERYA